MNASLSSRMTVVIIANPGTLRTFVVKEADAPPAVQPGETHLAPGDVIRVERANQTVRVVSGCAWITLDGEDILLEPGQQASLGCGDDALISALGDEPLVYRLHPAP